MSSVALKLFARQGAWTHGQSGDYIVPPFGEHNKCKAKQIVFVYGYLRVVILCTTF